MDLSAIFKSKDGKTWWVDIAFYFVMSLLIATVVCYVIFFVKNNMQEKDIALEIESLKTVGTARQKEQEEEVLLYQKKIHDYSNLFESHGFASQVFSFMQQETRPNIWFERFGLREKESIVELAGEADNNEAFSRQISVFERSEYVMNISLLNSSLDKSNRIKFNITLLLDPIIFTYISDLDPNAKKEEIPLSLMDEGLEEVPEGLPGESVEEILEGSEEGELLVSASDEKLLIIFEIINPVQVSADIDLEENAVSLDVPFGTDVTNLSPSMIISQMATIMPSLETPQDFTNPVIYTVRAEDGTIREYTVTINVLPGEEEPEKFNFVLFFTIISIISVLIIGGIVAFIFYKRKQNSQTNQQSF